MIISSWLEQLLWIKEVCRIQPVENSLRKIIEVYRFHMIFKEVARKPLIVPDTVSITIRIGLLI
jgi:hypothetical protein